ncbi:MAG: polyphenol oxidase family protein [Candidatus Moraniibacteriota bacterium]
MKKILKGFSEKKDGLMYLPMKDALPENVANRKLFFESKGLSGRKVVVANLVHGTTVAVVDARAEYFVPATDALLTKAPEIILTLTGADCFPVYLEEKTAGIIGLAHCGWRGIVGEILPKTIAALIDMGGKKESTVLTIGPGICARHFEITEDVLSSFSVYPEYIVQDKNIRVDLKGIIKKQAQEAGIASEHIVDTDECTYCLSDKYFSYRRDQPKTIEAQVAYIVQFPHRKF